MSLSEHCRILLKQHLDGKVSDFYADDLPYNLQTRLTKPSTDPLIFCPDYSHFMKFFDFKLMACKQGSEIKHRTCWIRCRVFRLSHVKNPSLLLIFFYSLNNYSSESYIKGFSALSETTFIFQSMHILFLPPLILCGLNCICIKCERAHPDPNVSELINAFYQTIMQINTPPLAQWLKWPFVMGTCCRDLRN